MLNLDICSVCQIYEILVIQIGILVITVGVLATILCVNSVNLIKYTSNNFTNMLVALLKCSVHHNLLFGFEFRSLIGNICSYPFNDWELPLANDFYQLG